MTDVAAIAPYQVRAERNHRLLIFAPWCYGHHPTYLQHLIHYWNQRPIAGNLDVLVSPQFFWEHGDVVNLSRECDRQSVRFVATAPEEQQALESSTSGWARSFQQYQIVCKYARQLGTTQGLILYFDSCVVPLVLGKKFPCPFSGIYYRPTLHYSSFADYVPTRKERLQAWKERCFLFRLQRNASLKTLFSLDPFAVEPIQKLGGNKNVIYLPDPAPFVWATNRPVEQLRQQLGIDPDRKVFLSFGRLSEARKGVPQLVEAISSLSSELCQQICLLFAGEPEGTGKEQLEAWLAPIRSLPVQIVIASGYVPESQVPNYFQLADVVLAPYQKHIGMSGILLLAAAGQKPVLSSSYGLMGKMVRRHGLGLAVDSTVPGEIAEGLKQFLQADWHQIFDRARMQTFAANHSVERFAEIVFQNV